MSITPKHQLTFRIGQDDSIAHMSLSQSILSKPLPQSPKGRAECISVGRTLPLSPEQISNQDEVCLCKVDKDTSDTSLRRYTDTGNAPIDPRILPPTSFGAQRRPSLTPCFELTASSGLRGCRFRRSPRDRREMVFNNSVALQSVRPKHKVQAGEPDDVPAAGVALAPAWQQEPVGTVQRVRHTMGLCPRILVTHLQQGDCNDIR